MSTTDLARENKKLDHNKALVATNLFMWVAQGLYTMSPIDLIPDLIPFLGWMDDLVGLMVTIAFTVYTLSVLYKHGISGVLPSWDPDPALATAGPATIGLSLDGVDLGEPSEAAARSDGDGPFANYEPLSIEEIRNL